jgi:D-arabinose 1-dehydrogenase-like Zn-dependent alcohol dehydrogenase
MQAIRVYGPNGPICYEQVQAPSPAAGEVVVAVHAVGLTAGELTWPEAWPVTPGHEI